MTNRYYKNEYTENQWIILIDNALKIGCKVEYNKYGNIATIDSTEFETILCKGDEKCRQFWAEHIHNGILNDFARKERRF